METKHPGLIADIGGTNARFALTNAQKIYAAHTLKCADYPTIVAAVNAYLEQHCTEHKPDRASFAIAGPISGDTFKLTNNPWQFSVEETRKTLKMTSLRLMNDFAAVAAGVPHIGEKHLKKIGGGKAVKDQTIGIIGPGTGLGVAALFWDGSRYRVNPCEGGHVTMPPKNQRQLDLFNILRKKYDHISAERVCSGNGLVNLYNAIRTLDDLNELPERTAQEISQNAISDSCACCKESLDLMLEFLGTVAGNLSLTLGAYSGIYIAGGIPTKLGDYFFSSPFRQAFEDKGRFQTYQRDIPAYLIDHPNIAFVGLQADLNTAPSPPKHNLV